MLLNKLKNRYKLKDKSELEIENGDKNIEKNLRKQNEYNYCQKEMLNILNIIDSHLNAQRIYLRIMKKYRWIDEKKFRVAMELIYEIGKILGGLIKYYAKNN